MFSYGLAYGWGFGFDPIYMLVIVVCMVIGGGAQAYIKSTYKTWQNVPVSFGSTGRDIAQDMLIQEGSPHTSIGQVTGELSDYFNPSDNSLHLSPANFDEASVASVAVACHEAGHAVQTAKGLVFCKMRTALVPVVNFAQNAWTYALFMGIFFNMFRLVQLGILMFCAVVLFQLVTLPVEIDASMRALAYLKKRGNLVDIDGARRVLIAAALTYVAAALVSIIQLAYLLLRTRGESRE